MAGNFFFTSLLAQADQTEGLDHDFRVVVPHRAGAQLHAVAHQVVLEGGDGQGVDLPGDGLVQISAPPLGMEKGLWQNSSSPLSSPISYMGKSTIQQNS